MNQPQVYKCTPHFEPPSHLPPHLTPLGCLEHWVELPALYSKFLLALCFTYGNLCVSTLLSPTLSPQVCSLRLHLHCCPADGFISTVFLDSIHMHYWQQLGHGSILHAHWRMKGQKSCGTQIPWNISHKEELTVSPNEVGEPRACYTEWSKSEREKQVLYINACIWNVGRWYWWADLQGSSQDADIDNRCLIKTVMLSFVWGQILYIIGLHSS